MTNPEPLDVDELIIDGLTNYVELSGDQGDVREGTKVYARVADIVRANAPTGEPCKLAFPSMIIRPEIRTECFVAVFDSKLVVAWQKGTFRKTTEVEVIPTGEITSAEVATSSSRATRGALLMTIQAGKTVTLVLPLGREDIGDAVRSVLTTDAT